MVVLDTNVVSFFLDDDPGARYYRGKIEGLRTFVSFQTAEELWYGAHARGWGKNRMNDLSIHLGQYKVIWPNTELVDICARLRAERRSAGRQLSAADAWVAATALMLQCPLASHDGDFSGIPELELITSTAV